MSNNEPDAGAFEPSELDIETQLAGPTVAPSTAAHDNLRDNIGQALSDWLTANAGETMDWFDARNVDALADEAMKVIELQPRGTDAQILKERSLTAECISGAIAFGQQRAAQPPDDAAWLRPFYSLGRELAEMDEALKGKRPLHLVRRNRSNPIEEQYRSTADLLRMARQDPDAVSAFCAGTKMEDTHEAIFVIKGNGKIKRAMGVLIGLGLLTSNPVNPPEVPK
ncbi:MAG: hypothetical protein V4757_02365 [Pseudomonadota bacterium]